MDPPPPKSDAWDRTNLPGNNFSNYERSTDSSIVAQSCSNSASALLPGGDEAQDDVNDRRRSGHSALDMVQRGIMVLEDEESLNAGYGSNLTIEGTVECDAALVSGQGTEFGSVGAVEGIKNPISLARSILEYARKPDPLGRISPLTLVSNGATRFADSLDDASVIRVRPEALISPKARRQWEKWTRRLAEAKSQSTTNKLGSAGRYSTTGAGIQDMTGRSKDEEDCSLMQDTVGAVGWHEDDGCAAGVSSGGLLLKLPGRLGEAAVFGAGCWAKQSPCGRNGVACSVSGTGEYIVRVNLARKLCEALQLSPESNKADTSSMPPTCHNPEEDSGMESGVDKDNISFTDEATEETDPHIVIERIITDDFQGKFWLPLMQM
ncbi:hypothetical protein CVT24_005263 [Panaeolus cyanescens]|uniref:Asparaginase n=1 Tax=Panaeolus cyanescens TaxID=181874 RepID=A0A409Y8Q8_9AGAR|nr:hypothetical protein CVT24_005263 [Panaeolus cyanescens]